MLRPTLATALAIAIALMADLKVSTTHGPVGTTHGPVGTTYGPLRKTYARGQSVVVPTFRSAIDAASELPRLYSLVVAQRGSVVLERYFNGRRSTTPANVKSVSKSVISALVGIAAERKLLSLDQPIAKYFPELPEPKPAITIEQLLTMQSGPESTSNRK